MEEAIKLLNRYASVASKASEKVNDVNRKQLFSDLNDNIRNAIATLIQAKDDYKIAEKITNE